MAQAANATSSASVVDIEMQPCLRHIDRKLFKLREMRGAGLVTVKYLGTEENTADLFTKILDRQPFEKHRKTVLNTAANDGVPSARDKKAMGAWPRRF